MASNWTAILWDMNGTLVDSKPSHHDWCREHLGLELDLRDWLQMKYRTYLARAADLVHLAAVIRERRQT